MTQWTWDPAKAAANLAKHRVSFELAARALDDPFLLVLPDPYPGEERWRGVGSPVSAGTPVLVVIYTESELSSDDGVGRIISARLAERHERTAYEEGKP